MICRRCQGFGEVYRALRPVRCPDCGGRGRINGPPLSPEQIERARWDALLAVVLDSHASREIKALYCDVGGEGGGA